MHIPTLNFILKDKKTKVNGKAPIYLRITLNSTRSEISTKIDCEPLKWDRAKGQIKGKTPLAIKYNQELFKFHKMALVSLDVLVKHKYDLNARNLKLAMSGRLVKPHNLINLYEIFIEKLKERVGIDFSSSSLEIHLTTFSQIKEFLTDSHIADLSIDDLSRHHFHQLSEFFKKVKGNQHNTVHKKIERFKSMLKWAYDMEYTDKEIGKRYKSKKINKETIFLTKEELKRLSNIKSISRLEVIRDIYLFMCYTGLAFNEVKSVKLENITRNIHGGYSLILSRKKTGKNIPETPLLTPALDMIQQYNSHPSRLIKGLLFPVPANQNFNAYLKELATLAKINKRITTHTARKTFATTIALSNGMSMEVLSKALGHSDLRITQESYAQLQDERLTNEFIQLDKALVANG